MQARSATASKISASFITLEEGFQQFGNDLNKLQVSTSSYGRSSRMTDSYKQFIELNATAFSKILKKVSDEPSVCSDYRLLTFRSGTKPPRSAFSALRRSAPADPFHSHGQKSYTYHVLLKSSPASTETRLVTFRTKLRPVCSNSELGPRARRSNMILADRPSIQ